MTPRGLLLSALAGVLAGGGAAALRAQSRVVHPAANVAPAKAAAPRGTVRHPAAAMLVPLTSACSTTLSTTFHARCAAHAAYRLDVANRTAPRKSPASPTTTSAPGSIPGLPA